MKYAAPLAALLAATSTSVLAQVDHADEGWSGEVMLNYAQSAGNTNTTNFAGKGKAVREGTDWRNTFKLEGSNETSENEDDEQVRTAEQYFTSAKADYKITEDSFLFGLLEYTNDRFSGYDYEAAVSLGFGHQFIKNNQHDLKADIGPGYRYSKLEETGDVEEEAMVRIGAQYVWTIREGAIFDEDFSTEIGEDKTITKSLTRLKIRINGALWGSISYEIRHTDEVPPDIKNSDRKTLLGVNYVF